MGRSGDIEENSSLEEDSQAKTEGILRRVVTRVIRTGKAAGQQAGNRIRSFRNGTHDEDVSVSYPRVVGAESTTPGATAPGSPTSSSTPPVSLRRVSQAGGNAKGIKRIATKEEDPRTRSALDIALQPLQALTASVQKQAVVLEGEISRRISDMEAGFRNERMTMGRKLEDQRMASRERLREAETQLQRLQILAAEKEKADETVRRVLKEKEAASAQFAASTNKLREEADIVRDRLDKERRSLSAERSAVLAQRASQEKERGVAQKRLTELLGELERERQTAKRTQDQIESEASAKAAEQAQALEAATDAAAKADAERQRADGARMEAEARVSSAEATLAAANADMAAARIRSESELTAARGRAELAEAEAVAARSASGMDALQNELARTASELNEQTRQTKAAESARDRIEAEAATRSRGLQELMEKNRARYEKTSAALQAEIKELSLLKSVAAGFEDMRSKLGIAQSREAELVRQVEELVMKIETLDSKIADEEEKSSAGAQIMEAKEEALKEAEAQLQAANDRANRLAEDVQRLPELQRLLDQASTEKEKQRQRADGLQARVDKSAAKSELVKDRMFDLERSVEISEWSERKLAKENEGLQSLIDRNRARYDREVASLKAASSDLARKTEALEALEATMRKQQETAGEVEKQISDLKEKSAKMTSELSEARNMLAEETMKRMQAESALLAASESSYTERRKVDDEMAELARLRSAVGELESAQQKKALAWNEERSSLTSRLEEALRSSEGLSARVAELEGIVEGLREESQKSTDEADGERRRLELELEEAKASAEGAQEERNSLQDRVADLMTALQNATGSVSAGIAPPRIPDPMNAAASVATQSGGVPAAASDTSTTKDDKVKSDASRPPELVAGTETGGIATETESSRETRPVPARRKGAGRLRLRPWQVGALLAETEAEKLAEEVRDSQATVAAIDDFLERVQYAAGTKSDLPGDAPSEGHELDTKEPGWSAPKPPTKSKQRSWVPWGRQET